MHPLLRDPRRLAIYLATWAVVGTLFASMVAVTRQIPLSVAVLVVIPLLLIHGLICLSAWWVVRGTGGSSMLELTNRTMSASMQGSAVWVGLGTPWMVLMSRLGVMPLGTGEVLLGAAAQFIVGVPLYGVSMGIHYLVRVAESAREAERRVLESQVATREAQLRALRAQLNPHFLFNSLNSINALVGSDPEGARRMCESLGDFLRRTLALGARESVSLEEELSLVDRYFAIEKVRFGARLGVESNIEQGAERCLVPPLLLQPLVENAVKHGIAERIEGGTIKIGAAVKEGALRLSVENEVDEDTVAKPGQGVGLENVRRRLEAGYGRIGQLRVGADSERFRAEIRLPAIRAKESA